MLIMKYHLQVLKKYLSLDATPEDIAQNLILKTCEIEWIEERKIPKSIVIGKIEQVEKHPDADKLNVCQVNCWDKWKYQIICWGTNVAVGLYVPVALVWTPFPEAWITIAKRAMRGIDSEGMICSKWELQINEDKDTHWIWDLAQDLEDISDTDLWTPLTDKFPWLDSTIFEVDSKSLTNRPDLTGHFWLAVDLNAIYPDSQKKFNGIKKWMEDFRDTNILEVINNWEKVLDRKVEGRSKGVNTYIALWINNVEIKKSDFFSRLQLIDFGSNPINNWVDFSNLFMNTVGLPIHTFDADKITWNIIVRDAEDGEKFTDLFWNVHELKSTDVVISDESWKALALAWVVWGLDSWITENTKNIIVELANFDPVAVRKTWTRLGLRTDAELRFEKNISPSYSLYCLLLFLEELKYYAKDLGNYELWGIASYVSDEVDPMRKKIIETPWNEMESLIFGEKQENFKEKSQQILRNLGFEVQDNSVCVPLRRGPDDMNIKEDITEEIARIWGYDTIKNQPLLSEITSQPYSDSVWLLREVEEMMVELFNFDQLETYPWVSKQQVEGLGNNVEELYTLQNPLNPEFPYLRDTMLYNLLNICSKSSKFYNSFKIFDIWKTWKKNRTIYSHNLDQRYAENHFSEELSIGACWYEKWAKNWSEDPLLWMKSVISSLLNKLGIKGKIFFEKSDFSHFHPKKQAKIILRNWPTPLEIGRIGSLHPFVLQKNKLPESAELCTFELNLEALKGLVHQGSNEKEYETFQDQILRRDLSFIVDAKEDFGNIITALEKMQDIQEVKVFDLYQWENLWDGKKSISVQIKIKGDWSMTTELINTIMQNAIKKVESTWAHLRA